MAGRRVIEHPGAGSPGATAIRRDVRCPSCPIGAGPAGRPTQRRKAVKGTRGDPHLVHWIRRKHPHLTWKQIRHRFYGADRVAEGGTVLYNPDASIVE
ncbi:hypothetical protein GCM10010430_50290 [Kitasatospora cystarginea]|uniref:Uncharacterized protein n=1 Tax=Kitasatospora cystarginea TaxID=58350 RepID=A0ABN3EIT6_9ACTN